MTMPNRAIEAMQRRAKAVRARAAIRQWEYRQRNLAHGVWFRWRLLLARAEEAWAISAASMEALVERGAKPEPVGRELQPAKTIVFARREELPSDARPLVVRLDAAMLEARWVVLVPFGHAPEPTRI